MAMPATAASMGTPASMSESDDPQVDAMEEEPLEDMMSDTTRIAYGKSTINGLLLKYNAELGAHGYYFDEANAFHRKRFEYRIVDTGNIERAFGETKRDGAQAFRS